MSLARPSGAAYSGKKSRMRANKHAPAGSQPWEGKVGSPRHVLTNPSSYYRTLFCDAVCRVFPRELGRASLINLS